METVPLVSVVNELFQQQAHDYKVSADQRKTSQRCKKFTAKTQITYDARTFKLL
jgi:hypothetical protein